MHDTRWSSLLALPDPPAAEARNTVGGLTRNTATQALWEAIDVGDEEAARHAVAAGASLNKRREGQSPLWRAVNNGQWDIAEMLRAAGADIHTKTPAGLDLFHAIARRDRVEEAERLVAWGCDADGLNTWSFAACRGEPGSPNLMEWCLERQPGRLGDVPGLDQDDPKLTVGWAQVGLRGSARLRALLGRAWRVEGRAAFDATAIKNGYDQAHFSVAAGVWDWILGKDDISLVRNALDAGWGTPGNGLQDPCWAVAHKEAWRVLAWMVQEPTLRQDMLDAARADPEWTAWRVAQKGEKSIQRLLALGVDLTGCDQGGQNLAHHLVVSSSSSPSAYQWLLREHPSLFFQPDHDGERPVDYMEEGERKARVEARMLDVQVAGAQASARSGPRL